MFWMFEEKYIVSFKGLFLSKWDNFAICRTNQKKVGLKVELFSFLFYLSKSEFFFNNKISEKVIKLRTGSVSLF
jgi:hypothetical protein